MDLGRRDAFRLGSRAQELDESFKQGQKRVATAQIHLFSYCH